jgi:DNA gyrase subunit B
MTPEKRPPDDEKRRGKPEGEPEAGKDPKPAKESAKEPAREKEPRPSGDGYGGDKIQVLEGLEAVRRRPGMYIGDTTPRGLHHLVYEIVDNAIDEAMAGFAKSIHVRVTPDDGIVVEDDGRGIPVDEVPGQGLPGVTVAYTKLHAGGKFDHGAYKVSGGLHGVGASVVNALSERCEVEVYRNGRIHVQAFERGKPIGGLEVRGKTAKRGTKVWFKPDPKIFPIVKFDAETIAGRLRELAFLNRGLAIRFVDERTDPPREESYRYDGGIREFVEWLSEGKEALHPDVVYVERTVEGVSVEVAFRFNTGYAEEVQSFANNIHTMEGGTHLSGFRNALTRRLTEYAKRENLFGKEDKPSGDNFREGLTAVVSVKVPDPQFEGQTKTKLGNGEVEGIVMSAFGDALATHLEENPRTAKTICNKAVEAYRAMEAARKARDLVRRKGALASGNLPGKLADCISHDLETTELFIVEGESAGGTAKMGRDRRVQAILPLRGKILNVEKARIDKMLGHEEIRTLITAIGTGIGAAAANGEKRENGDREDGFDIGRLRYGKIIIMTDADVDGSHIRTLLLTFFFRHMLPLIENGRVYVAQPPLFKITRKKAEEYVYDERVLKERLQSLGTDGARLEPVAEGEAIQGASLGKLLDALAKLEELARAVERRGVPVATYLAADKDGRYPMEVWRDVRPEAAGKARAEGPDFVRTEEGRHRRKEQLAKELGRDPKVFYEGDDPATREGADVVVSKFYEHVEIAKTAKAIERLGVDPKAWSAAPGADGARGPTRDAKPIWKFVPEGGEPVPVAYLRDLLQEVRKAGQRGVDVQRYKGLGEMNPDQLKATTMDPERRTLVQVRLSEAKETADRLFGLLMGESVEPRKVFIEQHAGEVTNLDV